MTLQAQLTYDLPKSARLAHRKEFLVLMKTGTRLSGRRILMMYAHRDAPIPPRLGITIIKKHGKAHDRNYFKRLVREAFRHLRPLLPLGLTLHVQPQGKEKALTNCKKFLTYSDILADLEMLLHVFAQ